MKRLTKNQVLLAAVGAVPTVSDAVNVAEPVSFSIETKTGEYKELDGKMGNTKTYVMPDYMAASGSVVCFLRSNGGGAVAPKLDDMFLMSGFDGAAIDSDGDGTDDTYRYTPNSSELANGVLIHYVDGIKRVIDNVSANLKFDFEVGAPAKVTFEVKGFAATPSTEPNPSVTLDNNELFLVSSVQAVTLSGATLELTSASFDLGNQINEIYAIGNKEFYRADFKARVSLNEKVGSDIGYWQEFLDGAIKSLEVTLTSKSGTKFIFKAPTMSYINISESGMDELEVSREFLCGNDFYFEFK